MGNPAKAALLLILLIFIIITFFALTGIDVRKPEQSANQMVVKLGQLNRAINQMMRNVIFSIRMWFQETFTRG
jgi:biopolymer transport protein ExbD